MHVIEKSVGRRSSVRRFIERLVYLPGAIVLLYGFWLSITA
ncbi:MAG: hypothetical protein AAF353_14265 [Pseudomonadota bacterium]